MKTNAVTIAGGKKDFSHLVKEVEKKDEDIVITRRGEPVAVLLSYKSYKEIRRRNAYKKILSARGTFLKIDISAEEAYIESKKQLEDRH